MDVKDIGEFCKSAVKALKDNGVVALLGEEYFVNNYGNAMIDALHKRDVDKIVQIVNECVFEYNVIQANRELAKWECEKTVENSSSLYCEEIEKCQIDSLKQIFSKIGTQIDGVDELVKENYKKEHPSENKGAFSENEGYQDEYAEDDEEEPYYDTDEENEEDSFEWEDDEEEDYDDEEELEGFNEIDEEDEEYYGDAEEDGEYDQYGEELANVVSFEDDDEEYDDSSDEEEDIDWEDEDEEEEEDTDEEDEDDLNWEDENEEEIEDTDEEETEDALDWEDEDEEEVALDERKPSKLMGMTDIVENSPTNVRFDTYFGEPRVFDDDKAQDTLVGIDKATKGISKIFNKIVQGINE